MVAQRPSCRTSQNADCILIEGSNMAEAHPVGLPVGDGGQASRRHGDPRRPAVHAHLGGRRPARPDPGGLGHRVPRWAGQPRAEQRPGLPRVRRRLHQRGEHHRRATSRTPRTSTGCSPASTRRPATTTRPRGATSRPRTRTRTSSSASEELEAGRVGRRGTRRRTRRHAPRATAPAGRPVSWKGRRDETLQDPQLRVPDPEAALRALHPRDGAGGLRHRARAVPAGGRRADPQQRARAHHRVLLRGRAGPTTASVRR